VWKNIGKHRIDIQGILSVAYKLNLTKTGIGSVFSKPACPL
jgi:hypothetical protein